jgi:hypothetical protein
MPGPSRRSHSRPLRLLAVSVLACAFTVARPPYTAPLLAAGEAPPAPVCVVHSNPSMVAMGDDASASSIADIIRVACKPRYRHQPVLIQSTQLDTHCQRTLRWFSVTPLSPGTGARLTVILDDNGNAWAIVWGGPSCVPGTVRITASLYISPFTTAVTQFTILAPRKRPLGVTATPSPFVEDATVSGVATVIQVTFPAAQAEQAVTLKAPDLFGSCGGNLTWIGAGTMVLGAGVDNVDVHLDHHANAFVVVLGGPSCTAGVNEIIADLISPPYTQYTGNFTVQSPHPTH